MGRSGATGVAEFDDEVGFEAGVDDERRRGTLTPDDVGILRERLRFDALDAEHGESGVE